MKRQEMWEESYRAYRYMEHLNEEELKKRFRDLMANVITVTPQGQAGMKTMRSPNGEFWMVRSTELLEEFRLRGGIPPWILDGAQFPLLYAREHPGAKAVEGRTFPEFYLIKLGKAECLKRALERGEFRIRPASGYSDPSLSPAIRDEELSLDISIWPGDLPQHDPRRDLPENVLVRLTTGTDYYVYCLSSVYDFRLYDDFKADACLLIHRPTEFALALLRGVCEQLPGWACEPGQVQYVDPINASKVPTGVFFLKHFRFAYQNEVRLVWIPPQKREPGTLEPLKVEVGSLADFCELIVLPEPYEKRLETAAWRPPTPPRPYDETGATGIDALPAGPQTDQLIFEHLIRAAPPNRIIWDRSPEEPLPYSTDQRASHAVMMRLLSYGWGYMHDIEDLDLMRRGGCRVQFSRSDGQVAMAEASTVELAICRAALKAAVVQELWDGDLPPSKSSGATSGRLDCEGDQG